MRGPAGAGGGGVSTGAAAIGVVEIDAVGAGAGVGDRANEVGGCTMTRGGGAVAATTAGGMAVGAGSAWLVTKTGSGVGCSAVCRLPLLCWLSGFKTITDPEQDQAEGEDREHWLAGHKVMEEAPVHLPADRRRPPPPSH